MGATTWIFIVSPAGGYCVNTLPAAVANYKAAYPSDSKVAYILITDIINTIWFDNTIASQYAIDGLHPMAKGHSLIAAAMAQKINAVLSAGSGGGSSSGVINNPTPRQYAGPTKGTFV
jgi:lysophospholipase L1-like esterase